MLTLTALALSLTACATPSPPVVFTPPKVPPPPPELMTPPDSSEWSTNVRQLFERWRQMLTTPQRDL